ncbi:hypothetical protein [Amycolatopsis pithecellobii]|uniref:hypothetical protein n=1 Tax=Amycolatopsis pithecellobii TaxID=664692 RepID=UPI0035E45E26
MAERSGVSRATLFKQFPSKAALSIIGRRYAELLGRAQMSPYAATATAPGTFHQRLSPAATKGAHAYAIEAIGTKGVRGVGCRPAGEWVVETGSTLVRTTHLRPCAQHQKAAHAVNGLTDTDAIPWASTTNAVEAEGPRLACRSRTTPPGIPAARCTCQPASSTRSSNHQSPLDTREFAR